MLEINTVKNICRFSPPLLAHRIQHWLIPNPEIQSMNFPFSAKSVTGGILSNRSKDFLAGQFYFHGYFDWRNIVLIKAILKIRKGEIIEVGANIGTETISYANLSKDKVHAFEPDNSNFSCLKEIKDKNGLDNLLLYKSLVSDSRGFEFFEPPKDDNSGVGYITGNKKDSSVLIETTSLDEKLDKIKSCAAIVIDVEGFEVKVLKGSSQIINKFRPFLIFEVTPELLKKRSDHTVKDLHDFMVENQYEYFLIDRFSLSQIDIKKFEKSSHVNWIGIPKDYSKYSASLSFRLFLNGINPFFSNKII